MENAPRARALTRGVQRVAAWIAICVVVIPNRPWKSIAAAIASAAMVPCGHLMAAQILGYPAMAWNRLASYTLGAAIVAGWTPFISTRLHRMQEDLSRSQISAATIWKGCWAAAVWAKCGSPGIAFYGVTPP